MFAIHMYIQNREETVMGDLKKKKIDFTAEANNKQDEKLNDAQTVEMLREYIKKFYEIQIEKEEEKDED